MSLVKKITLLTVLLLLNVFMIEGIKVEHIEWRSLFPQQSTTEQGQNSLLQKQKQYLFCHFEANQSKDMLQNSALFDANMPIQSSKNSYICIFDANKSALVLQKLQGVQKSGTLMLQKILFDDFYAEIRSYSIKILPFTLLILLLIIPLRLWLDILLEMALYTLLLSTMLRLGYVTVNAASLLALLFLVIYSLTLINYLYSEKMDIKRLFFGIQISIIATIISALFLVKSQFGLIHSFGLMLLIGLIVLYIYMNIRLYFVKYLPHEAHLYKFDMTNILSFSLKKKWYFLAFTFALIVATLYNQKNFSIDLNIMNTLQNSSSARTQINNFEKKYANSLLFAIAIKTKKSSFRDEAEVKNLILLQKEIVKIFPNMIIQSIPTAFNTFKSMAKNKNNPNLLAQFLLANSFVHRDVALFSPDMTSTLFIASIPLTASSNQIIEMKKQLEKLALHYSDFSIKIKGKIADFDNFLKIFFQESFIGLFVTLAFTSLFFLLYCKNIFSVFVVFLSVLFSLSMLIILHILFAMALSIMTLMSLILYSGLVADSFIQLFICYKSRDLSCEKSVLNPIFVSNISILAFLFGMIFTGGILGAFAFDMFVLLGANLLFILIFVPLIYKRYLSAYSD